VLELARRDWGQISILRALEKSRSDPEVVLPTGPDGACVFYEHDSHLCALHRLGGAGTLPAACRHFPRVLLQDGRGMSLSLSHFCPTAAGLLLDGGSLEVVDATPPLMLDGDLEAFDAWERAAVQTLGRDDLACDASLAIIDAATEQIRPWKPGGTPLVALVAESFHVAAERHTARKPAVEPGWGSFDGAVRRYLAAKVFGNRLAYECLGLRSIVEWLRMCPGRLRREAANAAAGGALNEPIFLEAVRATDLALVHRTDTAVLARSLERIEQQP
jgi:hypothetical protein